MYKKAILCVDDEEIILDTLETQLREHLGHKYSYELAESAEDALEIIDELNESGVDVLVVISDWLMPGIKGDDFLIAVHKKIPKTIKVLLTGQADEKAITRAKTQANLNYCIYKPWDIDELIGVINKELEAI